MSTKKQLVPAVAYLRKSTKGKRANGQLKQEKSLAQQRKEIIKLAADRSFTIVEWFEDEGISGWKRGAQRPDYQRMLDDVKDRKAQAIICDNLDRFSRATIDDVQEDVSALRKAGVRWIVTASHGDYDLNAGQRNDIGGMIKFVAAVWAAHEYSRNLSRRVALARRNAILEGIRPDGRIAYGYAKEGKHGLKVVPEKAKTVRWIFAAAAKQQSPWWIAGKLNGVMKVPGPTGGRWYIKTIEDLLKNPTYIGELQYGNKRNCAFFTTDDKGEVVERKDVDGRMGKVWRYADHHPAIVDRKLFAKVQKLFAGKETRKRGRRRLHALTGVLVCGKCGRLMDGTRKQRSDGSSYVIYRCTANTFLGKGACETAQVKQDEILPFLMKLLGEQITNLRSLLYQVPEHLTRSRAYKASDQKRLQQQKAKLEQKINNARKSMYEVDDQKTRKEISEDIAALRTDLQEIENQLATEPANGKVWVKDPDTGERIELHTFSDAELDGLDRAFKEFQSRAVSIPLSNKGYEAYVDLGAIAAFHQDHFVESAAILAEPIEVNRLLVALGANVTLDFETLDLGTTRVYKTRTGKTYKRPSRRHVLKGGRFQLGQRKGKLPRYVLDTMACPSN